MTNSFRYWKLNFTERGAIFYRITELNNIVDTWHISEFPNPDEDSGEFVFKTDGSFTSVFIENETSISSGSYTYANNTLTLNYTYSTNLNLQGDIEIHDNVTVSDTELNFTERGAIFYRN